MRQIPWPKTLMMCSAFAVALQALTASADELYRLNQNQNGFDLPGVALPQGQDEVRAADGTTCRSAVSGAGAYLDIGVIRNGRTTASGSDDLASYGRVVIPLGRKPKRLDCEQLYRLEVERLKMELEMMKMGLGTSGEITSAVEPGKKKPKGWADTGWTDGN